MSLRRLTLTTLAMALIAVLLAALTPHPATMLSALNHAQRSADTDGPDVLVLSAAGLLGWGVWAWGALGLALTAASALPGAAGAIGAWLLRAVLPAGARQTAALALGLGLGVAGPLLTATVGPLASPAAATVSDGAARTAPDWPASGHSTDGPDAPDWPAGTRPASHVVAPGDCLWDIALANLIAESGSPPTDGEVAAAVDDWWTTNRTVIGGDPDLLLPGQVLEPPDGP